MTSLSPVFLGEIAPTVPLESLPPEHRFELGQLRRVSAPEAPPHFHNFWRNRFEKTVRRTVSPTVTPSSLMMRGVQVFDLRYASTDGVEIRGWLTVPVDGTVRRGLVVGHGYGGRMGPDSPPILPDAAILYPCFRGLARSSDRRFSSDPNWHVLHDIDQPERYIHGGCVEDLWLGVSALLSLYPQLAGRIGFAGSSFSGGVGALALAWETRISRGHFSVPSFGNHPLRLRLATHGSGAAVQRIWREGWPRVQPTLELHDAAIAARSIEIPIHCACALSDPMVTPPGQFSIFNALAGPKELFVLSEGHSSSSLAQKEAVAVAAQLVDFFAPLLAA